MPGRALVAAQHARDLLDGQALPMAEQKGRTFHGRQAVERRSQLLLELSGEGQVVRSGLVSTSLKGRRLGFASPRTGAQQVKRAVGGDSMQPGGEAGPLIELA